jgi:4-diphosphocytidyl-2-C-methyl-D-erythritol kinase
MTSVSMNAPAKVNLFLEILNRRPDGYHTLSTVFQQISLGDRLSVAAAARPGHVLTCSDPSLSAGPDNLVLKAARLFADRFGGPAGLRFRLTKKVPVGAGLGGGSSDAAAALKALWRLTTGKPADRFPAARFAPLAKGLGADVSFFLRGGRAKAGGIGHDLTPLPRREPSPYWFVLVFPRVFTSTAWVYKNLRFPLTNRRTSLTLTKMLGKGRPAAEWAPFLFNRLEEVVLPRVPAVREARNALSRAGSRKALMSGSGSSVFGVVDSPSHGRRVLAALPRGIGDAWIVRSASEGGKA